MSLAFDPENPSKTVHGPWTCGFVLRAPLTLRSKSNFRRHRTKKASGSWGDSQDFERSLALLLRAGRPQAWQVGEIDTPVAERPVVVAAIVAKSVLDVANFSKSVLDAGEGVLYVSDASVLGETSIGVRGRADHLYLGFAQLPAGAASVDVHAALTELTGLLVPHLS